MAAEHINNETKDKISEDQNEIREKLRDSLFEEFMALHERTLEIIQDKQMNGENMQRLIASQISLSQQIVRETRALNGESTYLLG